MRKSKPTKDGQCKLTLTSGRLVKSHIIPKALTRPEFSGGHFIQGGVGVTAKRRFDSWYDSTIVTRQGEDILEEIDAWAIQFLRSERLVWSGWGAAQDIRGLITPLGKGPHGYRRVSIENPLLLRKFFLSVLWRSAVSCLPEMSEVTLPPQDLEIIRRFLVENKEPPIGFYPINLTQISTRGAVHNATPIRTTKEILGVNGETDRNLEFFRFYFDGIIAHIHDYSADDGYSARLGELVVGKSNYVHLLTIDYDYSFEKENLEAVISGTMFRK